MVCLVLTCEKTTKEKTEEISCVFFFFSIVKTVCDCYYYCIFFIFGLFFFGLIRFCECIGVRVCVYIEAPFLAPRNFFAIDIVVDLLTVLRAESLIC